MSSSHNAVLLFSSDPTAIVNISYRLYGARHTPVVSTCIVDQYTAVRRHVFVVHSIWGDEREFRDFWCPCTGIRSIFIGSFTRVSSIPRNSHGKLEYYSSFQNVYVSSYIQSLQTSIYQYYTQVRSNSFILDSRIISYVAYRSRNWVPYPIAKLASGHISTYAWPTAFCNLRTILGFAERSPNRGCSLHARNGLYEYCVVRVYIYTNAMTCAEFCNYYYYYSLTRLRPSKTSRQYAFA